HRVPPPRPSPATHTTYTTTGAILATRTCSTTRRLAWSPASGVKLPHLLGRVRSVWFAALLLFLGPVSARISRCMQVIVGHAARVEVQALMAIGLSCPWISSWNHGRGKQHRWLFPNCGSHRSASTRRTGSDLPWQEKESGCALLGFQTRQSGMKT
ncbi:hypothetical protein F5X68DRAFT_209819, partial [Plectosphaerella plurivora]